MASARAVRYVRCDGPAVRVHPPGAKVLHVRIERQGEKELFGGYVVLNADHEVIEKSSWYGMYEGEAYPFGEDEHCVPSPRGDFEAAWDRPYARRSLMRRFLSSLNGADDRIKPDDDVTFTDAD
jgi:hypothetical protein